MHTELLDKMLSGDRRALSKLLSLLEREPEQVPVLMEAVHPHTGGAYCVGVTGPPGAGKSTLIDRLVTSLKGGGAIGVLAVDPTSPFTSGALLGDRIRMKQHFLEQDVFIRSLATRGAHGGLSRITGTAVRLMDAFGFKFVVVESVGVGQTELDVMNVADTVVVTLVPEAGDAVQAMKSGLREIADILVVNKADRKGADRVAKVLRSEVAADNSDPWWTTPVLLTDAIRGVGIEALHQAIRDHRLASEETSNLQRRRSERRKHELSQAVRESIEALITEPDMQGRELRGIVESVASGKIDPYSAAARLLESDDLFSPFPKPPRPR